MSPCDRGPWRLTRERRSHPPAVPTKATLIVNKLKRDERFRAEPKKGDALCDQPLPLSWRPGRHLLEL